MTTAGVTWPSDLVNRVAPAALSPVDAEIVVAAAAQKAARAVVEAATAVVARVAARRFPQADCNFHRLKCLAQQAQIPISGRTQIQTLRPPAWFSDPHLIV